MELRQLTFLRFLAASGVVVFHTGRGAQSLAFAQPLWDRANTAVSFFFVLSGFLLGYVYSTRGIARSADFYVARAARIVPLYWLALVASALYELYKGHFDALEFGLSSLLVQAWWPGFSQVLNEPGWSLSVEVFFYLCFPFLLRSLLQVRSSWGLVLVLVGSWATNLALHIWLLQQIAGHRMPLLTDFTAYHPLPHLGTFVAGIASGLLFKRHRIRIREVTGPLMIGSALAFLLLIWIPNPIVRYHHNGLFVPLFVAFLWGFGAAPDMAIARAFSWAPLVLLGEISYGIYILQGPLHLVCAALDRHLGLSPDAFFWSYYGVLVGIALLCFKWIEVPLRERIKEAFTAGFEPAARRSSESLTG